ncbi:enoyl-CoA hydratase/isomerase family protein [Escherichia coli]|uniref:enoyl-CoA hydratase/isomerase family protein n=1 Tax=Escherichia coli TaxID=562 RepID=UPI0024DDFB7B|nr:enoyl-CoA hydratase/isomerase family protein [Escherichia coli]
MNNGTIDLQRNGFIATLVINRPAKLNALTPEMLEQLLAHCHTLETDSEIRVVLLTSASEKAFCVGADIHRWTSLSALDMWRNWIRRVVWNWLLPPISVFVAPKHKWHYQKPGWRQCLAGQERSG